MKYQHPGSLMKSWLIIGVSFLFSALTLAKESRFQFSGPIQEEVLEAYLSRAVTHAGLLSSSADPSTAYFDDDLRMLTGLGAKFIGRATFAWDLPDNEEAHFAQVKDRAQKVHQQDPEILLQAAVFEFITERTNTIPIPAWVFQEFSLPVEKRNFSYEQMRFRDGKYHNHWRPGASVPDISQLETRLYFYYRARRYLESGCEAIHFGQVKLMDDADPGHRHWFDLLGRLRKFAQTGARRGWVLCDAHTHGEKHGEWLLFDFHSYPMRLREVDGPGMPTKLSADQDEDLFGNSRGGRHPAGWYCDANHYLVELDNYGFSGQGGERQGGIWVWGYDEISWFAHLDANYRATWLTMAHEWVGQFPKANLQMPTRRFLAAPLKDRGQMYHANRPSEHCPVGLGVEDTIRKIWQGVK